jgi:predicted transcriptional regulator
MENTIQFELKQATVENLHIFADILKKDINIILEEALDEYFVTEQKRLLEKNLNDENAMTNLDFDEFWDDVDLDE